MNAALAKVMKALSDKKDADELVRARRFPYSQAKDNYDRALESQKVADQAIADALLAIRSSVEVDGVVYRATDRGTKGYEVIHPIKVGAE